MSLRQIEVSRKEILEIVKINKQKHDKILTDAIEGYWLEAERSLKTYKINQLKELKKNYQKSVKNFKKQINKELDLVSKRRKDGIFQYMTNRYPEDHTDDYQSVIRKLELCVEDNVELDDDEFNQYVRNKWTWRDSFITTNSYYSQVSGACKPYLCTGSCYYPSYFGNSSYSLSSSYSLTASYSSEGNSNLNIFSTGNVGLGTSTPGSKLDIDF